MSWDWPRRGEFAIYPESPFPLVSRSFVYWFRPTRPRRAGGRPDLRVDGRTGVGSWGVGVLGLAWDGSRSGGAVLVGEPISCSDSVIAV
jgi:hypothetical protein